MAPTPIPVWATATMLRASILAGVAWRDGATLDETVLLVRKTLGESNARPVVRPAKDNKKTGGVSYADVGAWQVNMVNAPKTTIVQFAKLMLHPLTAITTVRRLMASGARFYGIDRINNPETDDDRILRAIADRIEGVLRELDRRGSLPIDPLILRDRVL